MFVARPEIIGAGLGEVVADLERMLERGGVLA